MPEMRSQYDDPPRTLRRIHGLQRVSGMQVREAELYRREVSRVQGWRTRRKAGAQGQYILRMRELSQVQIHLCAQADCGKVYELRQRISGFEELEGRHRNRLPEQRVRLSAARASGRSRSDFG